MNVGYRDLWTQADKTPMLQLNLIHVISNITAVIACLRFYKVLKVELAGHRPLSKLFAFKLLVGLNILMNVSFLG